MSIDCCQNISTFNIVFIALYKSPKNGTNLIQFVWYINIVYINIGTEHNRCKQTQLILEVNIKCKK